MRPTPQCATLVVINKLSGTVRSLGAENVEALVREKLASAFGALDIELCEGDVLPPVKKAVVGNTHRIVIAGGGDGTIASVAAQLRGSGMTLGVLPLGTMNLFVQSLGFSSQLEQCLDELASAREDLIDCGSANGRVFVHQVSFGLQPRMARLRERIGYSSRLTKIAAAARSLLALLARPKLVRIVLEVDGQARRLKTPLLTISNNPLGAPRNAILPASLKTGSLGLYLLGDVSSFTLIKLARDYLANRVVDNSAVTAETATKVRISNDVGRGWKTHSRRSLLASMDGEVVLLDSPVVIETSPASLRVLVPEGMGTANGA